jgi:N-acetylmuramoyl-L-alanine amidase
LIVKRPSAVAAGSVFTLLALAAPSFAALPFGKFGGQVGGGNAASGHLPIVGWALDDDGIIAVDILVDGRISTRATYGRSRPGVTLLHPGLPDSSAPGWAAQVDTTRYLNGKHVVSARALSATGETKIIGKPRTFQFGNLTGALLPFGDLEFPNPSFEMFGNCTLIDPARRYNVVSGYALDAGIQFADRGVAFVELMIDRALFANTRSDCVDEPTQGGLSNCYGIRRLDIEQVYPTLPDSPGAGFRFVLDVGFLIASGLYNPGHHVLTIRVGDHFGQLANIDEIPVRFQCDEDVSNEGSEGFIEFPGPPGLLYAGNMALRGWAVDWEGVNTVTIYVDGAVAGVATYGLLRPEVTALFPGFPDSAAPGWTFNLDSTQYSNGVHSFQAIVTDDLGKTTLLGERSFVIANP